MKVVKTIKLYIDGKFERTESGRSYSMNVKGKDIQFARLCQVHAKILEMRWNHPSRGSRPGLRNLLIIARR